MQRVNLTSLLVATLILGGCESGTSTGPDPIEFVPVAPSGQGFVALYAPPPFDVVPYPNDIYNPVAAGAGPTLAVPATRVQAPLAAALNTLDGFSTVAKITAPFNDVIDQATLIPFNFLAPTGTETVYVLDATNGVPLIPGVHYAVGVSTSAGAAGAVLEITPLQPLSPQTTYVFILTSGIQSTAGIAAGADQSFAAVRDSHLAGLTSVPGASQLDPLFPAITPLIDTAVGVFGLPGASVAVAWSATTQSITDVLDVIEQSATPQFSLLAFSGVNTSALNPGLPGIADIYVGFMEIPYFGDTQDVLGSFWINAGLMPPTAADPVALPRVPALRIPVMASLPNAGSGRMQPAGGWPVVLYIHGVTSDRLSMVALADSFASQGFAVVAIDLPIHGITDTTNPFYQGPENMANLFGNNERHFYLDNVNAGGLPIPDGMIDSGIQIFNIANPLNARDHIRQAVSDLIHLARTAPTMDFDGDTLADLDGDNMHFVSISLGSIFSGVFLGLDTAVGSATLSSPAAPWSAILEDPEAVVFGQPLRDGLAAQGLAQGTVTFDNFVRDLQNILDPSDPMNYATAATANHPLHILEILGDSSVPNAPTDFIASLWGASDVTAANPVLVAAGGARGIVRFTSGGHTSLLSPTADPAVTAEMQTQMVTFAVTGGTTIAVSNTTVVQ